MKNSEALSSRIRERRHGTALSQAEPGERLNVSQATISLWEQGKATPGREQLLKLSEILGD